ncbi:MAG: hypothetical protein NZ528_08665 [Caldilineales bacterium]|nr:hypothetical protein [Caldilineales bacterium]MDW8319121.1 hypothetical protein [Anaerolineae bacterium]
MPSRPGPDPSLFVDVLHALEEIGAPYAIVGAFAGAVYGVTRTTYDIDIVVDLSEEHIQRLAARYPPPRYYADAEQMRNSWRLGMMFNIIDGARGEKADLIPVGRRPEHRHVLAHRVRQLVTAPGAEPFYAWCARPEDVIIGKLKAWAESGHRRHETDIYEMVVFHHLSPDPTTWIDLKAVDAVAAQEGEAVAALWEKIKQAARAEAERPR